MRWRGGAEELTGFSKELENLAAAVAIFVAYCNFCWTHKSLTGAPAMEAKVAGHLRSMDDLYKRRCSLRSSARNTTGPVGEIRWGCFLALGYNRGMRHLFHRLSLCAAIGFLCALPLGVIAEVNEWGQMPEHFEIAFFFYAWVFALIHHGTRPSPPAPPQDPKARSG